MEGRKEGEEYVKEEEGRERKEEGKGKYLQNEEGREWKKGKGNGKNM